MLLTDRSRHVTGLEQCQRARYWAYEYQGRGLRPKSLSIPLATGIYTHRAIEQMLKWVKVNEAEPGRLQAREWIRAACNAYRDEAEAAGFAGMSGEDASADVKWLIDEQACLIEGLAWAFFRVLLPFIVREYRVVAVEEEVDYVLGCTCGLGDGNVGKVMPAPVFGGIATHEGRICAGVALMSRADFITKRISDGAVGVWDLKTSSGDQKPKEMDHMVQMALGIVAAGALVGEDCTHHYLVGLHKGVRKSDDAWGSKPEKPGLKRQRSGFCYLYYKPADPPYGVAEYSAEYTSRKGWGRVPVWELQFPEQDSVEPGASPVEYWVMDKMRGESVAEKVSLNGPTQAPVHLIPSILAEVEAEARAWEDVRGAVEEDPNGINTYIRRSWDCYPYGEACAFLRICAGDAGMQMPESSGRFQWREPHHALEVKMREELECSDIPCIGSVLCDKHVGEVRR